MLRKRRSLTSSRLVFVVVVVVSRLTKTVRGATGHLFPSAIVRHREAASESLVPPLGTCKTGLSWLFAFARLRADQQPDGHVCQQYESHALVAAAAL